MSILLLQEEKKKHCMWLLQPMKKYILDLPVDSNRNHMVQMGIQPPAGCLNGQRPSSVCRGLVCKDMWRKFCLAVDFFTFVHRFWRVFGVAGVASCLISFLTSVWTLRSNFSGSSAVAPLDIETLRGPLKTKCITVRACFNDTGKELLWRILQ